MEELIHQFILVTQGVDAPPGEIYFGADNPKGELGFYINSKGGGTPHRLKIRAPSFVNLSILPELLPGHMMSDTVAILGTVEFVECLASCGTAPVMMVNEDFYEGVTHAKADELIAKK